MRRSLLCVAILCVHVSTSLAQNAAAPSAPIRRLDHTTITSTEIDATVTRLMHAASVPAIAILNDNQVVFEKAYGFRDTARHLPLTTSSIMTSASLTKSAFACLVMQL